MRFLLSTLSLSYASRNKAKTFLTLLGVVVGVATFSAIRGAQGTLIGGIRSTVDRMAGKAQLQVVADGGVPEELAETIRLVPLVKAQSPVIEQVAVPERGELGSLLVLGVDLLGDREMRDYGFEGEDADLDDPLLFLAQPDSVAVARPLAKKAGLKVGDAFTLRTARGMRRVTVRGLLTPKGFAEAFGGNLILMDVYAAQDLFARGRRFDRIEIRLAEGASLDEGTKAVQAAIGPTFRVETPGMRGAQLEKLIANFVAGFHVSSGFALGIGTFLIFNSFAVAVNRRRRDIGTLRSLGATPRQVALLFLFEAAILGLLGGVLGLLLGSSMAEGFLRAMEQTSAKVYGVVDASTAKIDAPLAVQSILLGLLASLAGAWGPAMAAARISPTEAFAKGSFQAQTVRAPGRRFAIGGGLLLVAVAIAARPPISGLPLIVVPLALFGAAVAFLASPASQLVLRKIAPVAVRIAPVAGQLASDSLLGSPRRTAGTVVATTLSIAFVLGLGGYMGSTKASMVRWMDDVLTSDIYVRASANFVNPDSRFPASLRAELEALPGVRSVESYRGLRVTMPMGDTVAMLGTIEVELMMTRVRHDFLEGNEETMLRGLVREEKVAVSENYAQLHTVGMGGSVTLTTPSGVVSFPIAAVFRDYTSDKGTIFMDRAVFLKYWKDDRVDTYDVNLKKGVDAGPVRDSIRALLGGRMPALVSTRREFVAEIGKAIDAFHALVRITVFLALGVAFLGIVTSLLISVAERTREIGILKALGAVGGQIARSVALEGVTLAMVGYLLAVPLGLLIALFMERTIAATFAGWRMPHTTPWGMLVELAIALPLVSAVAAFVPARQAAGVKVTEAIEYE